MPLLSRRQLRAGRRADRGGDSTRDGSSSGLRRLGILLAAAALALLPSGLLVWRMMVRPHRGTAPAPAIPPQLEPALEPPPAAASEAAAGPQMAKARFSSPPAEAPSTINVAMATDEEQPIGLLAVVNSTLTTSSAPGRVRFHIIVAATQRRPLRTALESLFAGTSFHMCAVAIVASAASVFKRRARLFAAQVLAR